MGRKKKVEDPRLEALERSKKELDTVHCIVDFLVTNYPEPCKVAVMCAPQEYYDEKVSPKRTAEFVQGLLATISKTNPEVLDRCGLLRATLQRTISGTAYETINWFAVLRLYVDKTYELMAKEEPLSVLNRNIALIRMDPVYHGSVALTNIIRSETGRFIFDKTGPGSDLSEFGYAVISSISDTEISVVIHASFHDEWTTELHLPIEWFSSWTRLKEVSDKYWAGEEARKRKEAAENEKAEAEADAEEYKLFLRLQEKYGKGGSNGKTIQCTDKNTDL